MTSNNTTLCIVVISYLKLLYTLASHIWSYMTDFHIPEHFVPHDLPQLIRRHHQTIANLPLCLDCVQNRALQIRLQVHFLMFKIQELPFINRAS